MKRAAMTAVVVDKEEMEDGNNNLPSFIGKLSLMLKDKTSTRFVKWSQGGSSFTVLDPPTFAAQVLPRCASLPLTPFGVLCARAHCVDVELAAGCLQARNLEQVSATRMASKGESELA